MTTPASPSDLHNETPNAAAALDLARLVVKAHACTTSADVAAVSRELLASLLTVVGAAHGALALTQLAEGAKRVAIRVLAAAGVDEALVPMLVAQVDQRPENHPALRGKDWVRIAVPLGESTPRSDGASLREAGTAHALLLWDEAQTDEQRARGERAINDLRDAISAVVVSVLATERRFELERTVNTRAGDHLNAELLGTVSHELRSPLAVIKGYATTLLRHERRLSRAERHEFLAAIDEATNQLDAIINRLLHLATLETGDTQLDRFAMDMVPIVRDAVAAARTRATAQAQAPASFTVHLQDTDGLDAEQAPLILADPRAMREVLDHLLENAAKYSPQGGEITATLRPAAASIRGAPGILRTVSSGSARYLEVIVRDQGVGIPDEHLGRIFDRFHRVDTRLTREVDGLGLGLAICRRIVELHGGAIWAESQPGEGSVFHMLLPVAA